MDLITHLISHPLVEIGLISGGVSAGRLVSDVNFEGLLITLGGRGGIVSLLAVVFIGPMTVLTAAVDAEASFSSLTASACGGISGRFMGGREACGPTPQTPTFPITVPPPPFGSIRRLEREEEDPLRECLRS